MKDDKKPSAPKPPPSTEEAIQLAKKAIDVQKQTSGKPPEEAEKEAKEDAERWRNEG